MSAEEFDVNMSPADFEAAHEFWDQFILREDGVVSLDNVYAELFDYMHVMEHTSRVYAHVTCGRISKPNTHSSDVISVANDCDETYISDAISEVLERLEAGETIKDIKEDYEL